MSARTTQPEIEGRLLGRAARIGRVMASYGLKELFASSPSDDGEELAARARRFRNALEELGPTFAKLGQVLSTRSDLLPAAFIDELATLQDHVPPMTEAEVVQVMEQELRVPWEDVFESIDPQHLAAGTIAQVHRATLESGDRVVVKVQRPNARPDILSDLGLLEMFADKVSDRPAFQQLVDVPSIIDHLSKSLQRELDFRTEAENIERMAQVIESYERLAVPRVYRELSTSRLLVMEEVQGVPLRQAPPGIERREAARQLLESYYRQVLTEGFFHADPHPGNLMWWDGRIYFLDFGMVGEIGPEFREFLILLLMAFWQEDAQFLSEISLMIAGEDQRDDIDLAGFSADLAVVIDKYRHTSLQEIQLGAILQEITEIGIRHQVRLPSSLALTAKALAQMQLATAELDPTLDPFAVASDYIRRSLTERIRDSVNPQKMFYEIQKVRARVGRLVEALERLTGARPGPKLQVAFRGLEPLETVIRRSVRRLALAMVASSGLVATAMTATSAQVDGWVPTTLGSASGALVGVLVVDITRRQS